MTRTTLGSAGLSWPARNLHHAPRVRGAVLLTCGAALWAGAARGQFQNATGFAESSADTTISDGSQSESASDPRTSVDFYPAVSLVSASQSLLALGGVSNAGGSVSANFASPRRVSLSGRSNADVDGEENATTGTASGSGALTITFSLPFGGTYLIESGSLYGVHAVSSLSLTGPGTNAVFSFDSISGEDPNGATGPLAAGVYTLSVSASSSSDLMFFDGLFADSGFDVDVLITPMCTADVNNDGEIDLTDFFDFLNCFADSASCADLDGVAGVDLGDFFAFFNAFDLGC